MARTWIGARKPPPDPEPEPGSACTGLCQGVAGATCTWDVFDNRTRTSTTVTGACPTCGGSGKQPG